MKVVLLQNVPKTGKKYEIKEVADGHALNLLIPRGLAEIASEVNVKKVEMLKEKDVKERGAREVVLSKSLKELEQITVEMSGKANDKGHLFAAIHRDEIAPELSKKLSVAIDPEFIVMEKPIKEVGEHMVEVKAGEKSAKFKLIVSAN